MDTIITVFVILGLAACLFGGGRGGGHRHGRCVCARPCRCRR